MTRSPSLRELQLELRRRIATPSSPANSWSAELGVHGDHRLSAAERVQVYAGMYRSRLRDALAEDYPGVRAAIGDEAFGHVVEEYVVACPSTEPSLRYAGRRFSHFVATAPASARWPWLTDLARFEWALVEAFDAVDEPTIDRGDLEQLDPPSWASLELRPVRSLFRLTTDFEVDVARQRVIEGLQIGEIARSPSSIRVWRQELQVFHRRIGPLEAAGLQRIAGGLPFSDLCAWSVERVGEEGAPETALGLIWGWVEDGLLVREATE